MYSRLDQRAELLAAARTVSENAAYMVGFPADLSTKEQIVEAASTVVRVARALGHTDLVSVSERLINVARTDLALSPRIRELTNVAAQVLDMAIGLTQDRFATGDSSRHHRDPVAGLDAMFTLADTRWVNL